MRQKTHHKSQETEVLSQGTTDFHQFLLEQAELVFQQQKTSMGADLSLHASVWSLYIGNMKGTMEDDLIIVKKKEN